MGKYVAVGVLAVIVLAAVTYESPPKEGETEEASQTFTGSYGTEDGDEATGETDVTPKPEVEQRVDRVNERRQQQLEQSRKKLVRYTVKKGQSLSDVAAAVIGDRGRWKELWEQNKDKIPDPNTIREGLTLVWTKVEKPSTTRGSTTLPAGARRSEPSGNSAGTYVVKAGDTLYAIARRELGKGSRWKEIQDLNDLSGTRLAKGQRLQLPAK